MTAALTSGRPLEPKPLPYYGNEVLIGNWFGDRNAQETDRHAITPALYGESSCVNQLSSYKDNFIVPIGDIKKAVAEFISLNMDSFANKVKGMESNIKFFNGDQFVNNMTTTTDIVFRIRPTALAGKDEIYDIRKTTPKEDFLGGYGNLTETGIRKEIATKVCCEKNIIGTTYRSHFDSGKLFLRKRKAEVGKR